MNSRDIDILAIGGIDRDLVLKVPYVPGHDEKVSGEFVGTQRSCRLSSGR